MMEKSSAFSPIFIRAKTGAPLTKTQINTKSSALAVNTSKEIPHGGIVGSLRGVHLQLHVCTWMLSGNC